MLTVIEIEFHGGTFPNFGFVRETAWIVHEARTDSGYAPTVMLTPQGQVIRDREQARWMEWPYPPEPGL